MNLETILSLIISVLISAIVFFVITKKQKLGDQHIQKIDETTQELKTQSSQTFTQNLQFQQIISDKFDAITKQLASGMQTTADRTTQTINQLHERLASLDKAQENINKLSGEFTKFTDILSNKQSRGAFGETQLKDLVMDILPPNAYEFQCVLSNGKRADCLIKIPNPPGSIVIDSKFPLENYQNFVNCTTDTEKAAYIRAFRGDVEKHIKDISEKYIIKDETSDAALMFIPSESIYAEIYNSFPGLVEKSFKSHVFIVSPTTVMATLTTIRAILKDAKMKEQTAIIQREVVSLLSDVNLLDERVKKLGTHFGQASKDLGDIQISTTKITKKATKIESIEVIDDLIDEDELTSNDRKAIDNIDA